MILLPDKWLFISTMKCATNTLYKDLQEQVPGTVWAGGNNFHAIPQSTSHPIPVGGTADKLYGQQVRLAPVHWTVVRNPYDRAVSIWASTCLRMSSKTKYDCYNYMKVVGADPFKFEDFVEEVLLPQPKLRVPFLYKTQSEWIRQFICDEVAHLETLSSDLEMMLGRRINLSMENKSEHDSWEKYYSDPNTREKVAMWAGADFLEFGYDF